MRIDVTLVERALATTRAKAVQLLANGSVLVNGKPVKKPAFQVTNTDEITLTATLRYVSRGGEKLEKALEVFAVSVENKTCMDIGASTGGFTDCLLQGGAASVLAIDTGTDQLDERLRGDPRIELHEQTNCVGFETVRRFDLITIDVSFVSLTKVLPSALSFLKEDGLIIALIKPQFEVGRQHLTKKGIVKDKRLYQKLLQDMKEFAMTQNAEITDIIESPIQGGDGNTEFLAKIRKL